MYYVVDAVKNVLMYVSLIYSANVLREGLICSNIKKNEKI